MTREPEHLLVVDDEPFILRMAENILGKMMGYRITPCNDGMEAIAFYRKNWRDINLVVLDLVMPKLSGHETFLLMKEINPDVRVILLTGQDKEQAQPTLNEGALAYLRKPPNYQRLKEAVQFALTQDMPASFHP